MSEARATLDKAFSQSIPWGRPFEPWVLHFVLVKVIGGKSLVRPAEKVAWVTQRSPSMMR